MEVSVEITSALRLSIKLCHKIGWLWNKFILFSEYPFKLNKMAGAEAELTGMAKHFNAVTMKGRANVAKVRH